MKNRALFVDDEPLVLSGLRRMLRNLRHDWDMSFANSGKEALALLDELNFAVVVSDMRMPEMDGATLLNEVAIRHPDVARLVLSGHAELDAIMRAVQACASVPCQAVRSQAVGTSATANSQRSS